MTAWNTILKHSSSFWKIILLRSKHPSYITSSKQSCRACESHNCGDGKEHASCLKPSQIILGGSGGQCGSHMKPMSNEGVNSLVFANQKNIIKIETWYLWKIARALETIWKCVQVGEMKVLRWSLWTNLPNHLCVMMVRSVRSKWETTWLQIKKKQSNYPRIMTAASRNLAKVRIS